MSLSGRNGGNITWGQVDKYLYLGTILVGVFIYISSIKTDVEVMKNDINHMKDMIKELHNQHIKDNGPVGMFYDLDDNLRKNCFIYNEVANTIPPTKPKDKRNNRFDIFWMDNRKKLVDDDKKTILS